MCWWGPHPRENKISIYVYFNDVSRAKQRQHGAASSFFLFSSPFLQVFIYPLFLVTRPPLTPFFPQFLPQSYSHARKWNRLKCELWRGNNKEVGIGGKGSNVGESVVDFSTFLTSHYTAETTKKANEWGNRLAAAILIYWLINYLSVTWLRILSRINTEVSDHLRSQPCVKRGATLTAINEQKFCNRKFLFVFRCTHASRESSTPSHFFLARF